MYVDGKWHYNELFVLGSYESTAFLHRSSFMPTYIICPACMVYQGRKVNVRAIKIRTIERQKLFIVYECVKGHHRFTIRTNIFPDFTSFTIHEIIPIEGGVYYYDYINSSTWITRRKSFLDNARHMCYNCSTKKYLQIHHTHYRTLGEESQDDIEILCRDCHETVSKMGA